jgi:dihydrofolate reductase
VVAGVEEEHVDARQVLGDEVRQRGIRHRAGHCALSGVEVLGDPGHDLGGARLIGPATAQFDRAAFGEGTQLIGRAGAMLYGRKTYEMMESFWTSPAAAEQMPAVAKGMNASAKMLVSRTRKPTWNNSTLLEGDLVETVRALKKEAGAPIVVLGSGSVVAKLGEAGLVDAYQLVVVPVALGAGRTLFTSGCKLRRVEQRAFDNGNVVVTYET